MSGEIKYEPRHDKLYVRLLSPAEELSRGGMVLPDTADSNRPRFGEVLGAGPGRHTPDTGVKIPMTTKKGEIVLFSTYAGHKIRLADQEYVVLRDEEVLMAVKGFREKGVDVAPASR